MEVRVRVRVRVRFELGEAVASEWAARLLTSSSPSGMLHGNSSRCEQSSPAKPSSHAHSPTSRLHTPWEEQLAGQRLADQRRGALLWRGGRGRDDGRDDECAATPRAAEAGGGWRRLDDIWPRGRVAAAAAVAAVGAGWPLARPVVVVVVVVVAAVRRSGGTGAAVRRMKRSHTPKPKKRPAASAARSLIRMPPNVLGEDLGAIRR